jgi:hypothetical protein
MSTIDAAGDEVGVAELDEQPATSERREKNAIRRRIGAKCPGGRRGTTTGAFGMGYVAGVAAGALVLGALEPPDEPEPEPEPPMFGQLPPGIAPLWFGRTDGAVEPPLVPLLPFVDGADEADGAGLAAETTAAAPPTRRSADSAAVMTVRFRPAPDGPVARDTGGSGDAGGATEGGGVRGAGIAGWTCCSTVHSFGRPDLDDSVASVAQPMAPPGPWARALDRLTRGRPYDRPRPDRPGAG